MTHWGQTCEHRFEYRGVVYRVGHQLAGSGARHVSYYDCYFCSRCLETRIDKLDCESDTYTDLKFGATPAPKKAMPLSP